MCFFTSVSKKGKQIQLKFDAEFERIKKWKPAYFLSGFKHPKHPVITNLYPEKIIYT